MDKVCEKCGGPVRIDSKYGICTRNTECKNAASCAGARQYYLANRESRRTYHREYVRNNRDQRAANKRKSLYGVSADVWQELTSNGCGICRNRNVKLVVDHDHTCCPTDNKRFKTCGNCVRGAICQPCNKRLGFAESNPGIPLSDAERAYIESAHKVSA